MDPVWFIWNEIVNKSVKLCKEMKPRIQSEPILFYHWWSSHWGYGLHSKWWKISCSRLRGGVFILTIPKIAPRPRLRGGVFILRFDAYKSHAEKSKKWVDFEQKLKNCKMEGPLIAKVRDLEIEQFWHQKIFWAGLRGGVFILTPYVDSKILLPVQGWGGGFSF